MKPLVLGANQPPDRFYRGGQVIAEFRGVPAPSGHVPEDWIGSTTTVSGEPELGLTRLESGQFLRDAVQADPQGWLGDAHVSRYGADPAVLVKLLDAGQRLPVHVHPDREFSRRHLDCPYGKSEAWVITGTQQAEGVVYLGFREEVPEETLADWVAGQDVEPLLAAMNAVPVRPGDGVFVPAGLPHAIEAGVFLVELQEPTDWSVLLEWKDFAIDGARNGHLGLGFDTALACVDRSGWGQDRLAELRLSAHHDEGVSPALPAPAEEFFLAERVRTRGPVRVDAGFSVLVVVSGRGTVTTDRGDELTLDRGMTVLLPHAAGEITIAGDLELLRCRPPAPGR